MENDTLDFVHLKFNEMLLDAFGTAEMNKEAAHFSARGLLQAAALTGALITHKTTCDMRVCCIKCPL